MEGKEIQKLQGPDFSVARAYLGETWLDACNQFLVLL